MHTIFSTVYFHILPPFTIYKAHFHLQYSRKLYTTALN